MKEIKISFITKRIIFRDESTGFTIASINIKKHPKNIDIPTAEPMIAGVFNSIHEKDEFEAKGLWADTGENGFRFNVTCSTLLLPETEKGVIEFIIRFSKGVGRVSAGKIVETFKGETLDIIINSPERLEEVKGVSEKQKLSIVNSITKHKHYEQIVSFLYPLGLLQYQMLEIYDDLGFSTIETIKANPYFLLKYDCITFKEADKMAKDLNFCNDNPLRIRASILEYIKISTESYGNMYTKKEDILKNLTRFLFRFGVYDINSIEKREIEENIEILIKNQKLEPSKDDEGQLILYIPFYKYIENEISARLPVFIRPVNKNRYNLEDFISEYEKETGFNLDKMQKQAINMAINNRISILNGGPGTGKTQTINAIIKTFKKVNPHGKISLAAPTGRAAKRMTELTGIEAKTIHRLIKLKGFGEKEKIEELETDFLIVDEASMIDAYLFMQLLKATTQRTKILIVGDYEQLPSVGPGLILKDLIATKRIRTTTLTTVFRQEEGSQIIDNANKVIKGQKNLSLDSSKGDFYFLEVSQVREIQGFILKSINRLLETGFLLEDIQVLSFLNKGDLGVAQLNKLIQFNFNPSSENKPEIEIGREKVFRLGDRVIHTINNYDLDVYNGDIGTIINIETKNTEPEIIVSYDDKDVIYSQEDFHEISLSYAITVHKSQGSEFPIVIIPIHKSLEVLINRSVLYTGITRAKRRIICIGDKKEFSLGIDRPGGITRNSMLRSKVVKTIKKLA